MGGGWAVLAVHAGTDNHTDTEFHTQRAENKVQVQQAVTLSDGESGRALFYTLKLNSVSRSSRSSSQHTPGQSMVNK